MSQTLLLLFLMGLCSFTLAENYTYHFINESKSWSEAQAFCKQNYRDLATVYNMSDVRRLSEAANGTTDAWIGLYNPDTNDVTLKWLWSQPEVEYNNGEALWRKNSGSDDEPNNKDGDEYCAFTDKSSQWVDDKCSSTHHFICYNKTSSNCELITYKKTWLQALHYCRETHTDLISGVDQLNDTHCATKIKSSNNDRLWIGLFRYTWAWSDRSSSSFRNWHESETLLQGNNKCAKLGEKNKWKSGHCTERNTFICYDDHYILVKLNLSWEEALYYCRQHHRDLAWITDKHQQRMVQERSKMADSEFVWLGLHYTCFLQEWVWVNGHYASYGNWKDPRPNDDCSVSGAMEKGGRNQWVKKPSEEKFNFVCAVYC